MKHSPYRNTANRLSRAVLFGMMCVVLSPISNVVPIASAAQAQDSIGIKRAFLDRYLDCAEAPDASARLECYDALLVDIPAWLEDPDDPPTSAIPTRADMQPLDVKDCVEPAEH